MNAEWKKPTMGNLYYRCLIALAVASIAQVAVAQSVTPCPNPANCAKVSVASGSAAKGGVVTTGVTFNQGPNDSNAGAGIDEVAALALTLDVGANLKLNDCTLDANGLPASVRLASSLSNFNLMVENAACANGKTHCLCPADGSGITPDSFINVVVFGPNPLPVQGTGVEIPVLPDGRIIDIDLKVGASASGTLPLHIYTESVNSSKPQFTAFLSTGDKAGTDVTCVRITGQPPCSAGSTSQVAITDGNVSVMNKCLGDCGGDGEVTVDELIIMVNAALGNAPASQCPAGDRNSDGEITIDEIVAAVSNALGGCPAS